MGINFQITHDNTQQALKELDEKVEAALLAVGLQAEGHAINELSNTPKRIDTGLLKNSITYAVSGKPTAKSSYSADTPKEDRPSSGSYGGQAPTAPQGQQAVYIGTNVEYAVYVHDGTSRMTPNRFLKNAMTRNGDKYKGIIEQELKK